MKRGRWLKGLVGVALAVPIVFVLSQALITWPLCLVRSVSQETEIKFPDSARLEKGHGYHFVSIVVVAKITMRRADLSGFLHQRRMGPPELPGAGSFQGVKETLSEHGIRVNDTHPAEFRRFNNGNPTWLLIDTQGTKKATVYVCMDEP